MARREGTRVANQVLDLYGAPVIAPFSGAGFGANEGVIADVSVIAMTTAVDERAVRVACRTLQQIIEMCS